MSQSNKMGTAWANQLLWASTEKDLCAALRAVPVPHGTVLYEALDNTICLPSAHSYPSADDVLAKVRAAQTVRPALWSIVCFGELRKLIARLGQTVTLREWVPRRAHDTLGG